MENNSIALTKKDIVFTLIIGEICSLLLIFIASNLSGENPGLSVLSPYLKFLPVIFPVVCLAAFFVAYLIGKAVPVIYQLAKFILVGGFNFLIDMGVLNILIFATGISSGITQSFFKFCSFTVAVFNSYFFNKHWTFKKGTVTKNASKEFVQFLVVSIVGLCINLLVDYVLVNNIGPKGLNPKTWAQTSGVAAAVAALAWNFLGYKFIVFKSETKNE